MTPVNDKAPRPDLSLLVTTLTIYDVSTRVFY